MDPLKYLAKKYKLDLSTKSPLDLPNVSRADLAKLFSELGFTKGAEVGTWTGEYSAVLCNANPKLRLIGIDLNSSTPKKNVPDNCKLVRMPSLDAVKRVVDGSLDFVYLDLNQDLSTTIANLSQWTKKVRRGGIIAGHDFYRFRPQTTLQTRQAVLAYTNAYHIKPWFVIGLAKERVRSWLWVNS
jgi:predicted O-methyltransferase YrrM